MDCEVWFSIKAALHALQEHVIQVSIPVKEFFGINKLYVLNSDFIIEVINIDENREVFLFTFSGTKVLFPVQHMQTECTQIYKQFHYLK